LRVALVTGSSSGIGKAAAERLAAEGWRVLLVARRADRLQALASELGDARALPTDVTARDAPERLRQAAEEENDLQLLVNSAGGAWRASFEKGGAENVRRTMELNFESVVRITEALLPLLRRSAPSSIVNVSSTAGRVAFARQGAYAASKFALAGWSESLYLEERSRGVHVGLVLPGFIATEGFPQEGLMRRPWTRWAVSTPEKAADAILAAGPGGKAERYVPRPYRLAPVARVLFPALWRRVV
jgi:uncharacterized protein